MAEGSDTKRRLIMMLTIILAGSAVTFLDLSPIIVIFIAVGIGLVMLFALNMITFEELKEDILSLKDRLNQPVNLKKDKSKKAPEKEDKKEAKTKEKEKSKSGGEKREIPFASLIQKLPFLNKEAKEKPKNETHESKKSLFSGLSSISGLLSRKKDVEAKSKKIDELLDKTLSEEFSPESTEIPVMEDESEEAVSTGDDEFSDFDNFDLGLEEEETHSATESMDMAGFEEEISESTIADILAKEGIELELTDEEFPMASSEETESETKASSGGGIGDIDELDDDVSGFDLESDELGDFDEIDLDELEPEDEFDLGDEDAIEDVEIGEAGEEIAEPAVSPVEEEDILSAPPKEWTQTKTSGMAGSDEGMFESPMSLSLGGGEGDEDDLFAMLKSDTKKAVSVQELSLVRDLKDAKIDSEELVEGLEEILLQFGIEKEQIQDKTKIIDEGDINN